MEMSRRMILTMALAGAAGAAGAQSQALDCPPERRVVKESTPALCLTQDRVYREGVFLVVSALLANTMSHRMGGAQVSVEFYSSFDELLSAEYATLRPPTLEPGQTGSLQVATPFRDVIRKIKYRVTWQRDGEQHQGVLERQISLPS